MSDATRAYYLYEAEQNRLQEILRKRRELQEECDRLLLEARDQAARRDRARVAFEEADCAERAELARRAARAAGEVA